MLNDMNSIDLILHVIASPLLRTRSSPFTFTHFLHSRYRTKDDIACYRPHPTHIFIPLKDDIRDHWFLLVMKLSQKNAELWDSQPDTGSGARRVEKARAAMLLLQNIFANEMTKSQDVYYDFPSFPLSVPDGNPTNDNNHNSGIYVARHMQSYREKWFEGYNSNEQCSLLALEIVKHPKNKLHHLVTKAASGRVRNPTGRKCRSHRKRSTRV
ncbi:hypothetical protein M0R45_037218 [Rubus argutus]|uniref:Ubiquitin-like protease family profile domain-containing protein n=1 Tax=Rubus argutus TaxID=59490 RepID=A0AAW1VZZ5_RUBAR